MPGTRFVTVEMRKDEKFFMGRLGNYCWDTDIEIGQGGTIINLEDENKDTFGVFSYHDKVPGFWANAGFVPLSSIDSGTYIELK